MNIDKLREEIEYDEGSVNKIYLDHLGLPTFGIGHLVTEWDEEYGLEVGTDVSEDRCIECFDTDIQIVLSDCDRLYPDFNELPEEVQLILGNMMFNLGRPRLSKFVKFRKAINNNDWQEAKIQMLDSKWAKQVPNRANRLSERMGGV